MSRMCCYNYDGTDPGQVLIVSPMLIFDHVPLTLGEITPSPPTSLDSSWLFVSQCMLLTYGKYVCADSSLGSGNISLAGILYTKS